jgi:heme-degrading monooxygenase HmoA
MQVIEWAGFGLLPGVTEAELLQAAEAMQRQFLDAQGGCLSRDLVSLGPDRYADVVVWQSQDAARAAMAQAGQFPACAAYFRLLQVDQPPILGRSVFSHGGHRVPQGMEISLFRLRAGADPQALPAAAQRMARGLYQGEPGFQAHGILRSMEDPGLYADVLLASSAGRARQLCDAWGQGPFDPACLDYLDLIAPGSARLQFWERVA